MAASLHFRSFLSTGRSDTCNQVSNQLDQGCRRNNHLKQIDDAARRTTDIIQLLTIRVLNMTCYYPTYIYSLMK